MKKILLRILGVILTILSLLLIMYPFISNYLMSLNDAGTIETFDSDINSADEDKIAAALADAQNYNKRFLGEVVITDPFDPEYQPTTDVEYESLLNLSGNGMMGYVEIPVINVKLPIYHGTSSEVLAKGVGHLRNTSLPIGGESTHAVLTGHTALPTARLFTDIDQLENGDVFFVHVLNETLAYQVDQKEVVLPSETDDLKIVSGKDYVTLVTCTPYGINTHRLLVRGERVDYSEAEDEVLTLDREIESTWMKEYKKALAIGAVLLVILIALFVVLRIFLKRRKRKKLEQSALNDSARDKPPDRT